MPPDTGALRVSIAPVSPPDSTPPTAPSTLSFASLSPDGCWVAARATNGGLHAAPFPSLAFRQTSDAFTDFTWVADTTLVLVTAARDLATLDVAGPAAAPLPVLSGAATAVAALSAFPSLVAVASDAVRITFVDWRLATATASSTTLASADGDIVALAAATQGLVVLQATGALRLLSADGAFAVLARATMESPSPPLFFTATTDAQWCAALFSDGAVAAAPLLDSVPALSPHWRFRGRRYPLPCGALTGFQTAHNLPPVAAAVSIAADPGAGTPTALVLSSRHLTLVFDDAVHIHALDGPHPGALLVRHDMSSGAAALPVSMGASLWSLVTATTVDVVLVEVSQRQMLDNLIAFEDPALANRLCALNNWDVCALRMHAIELGVRYRQPAVVNGIFAQLDADQQWEGLQLLFRCVCEQTADASEHDDASLQLLRLAMALIANAIRERPTADELAEKLTALLCEIQAYYLDLRPSAAGPNGERRPSSAAGPRRLLVPTVTTPPSLTKHLEVSLTRPGRSASSASSTGLPSGAGMSPDIAGGADSSRRQRWAQMDANQIVREALLTGDVSMALAFLQRHFVVKKDDGDAAEACPVFEHIASSSVSKDFFEGDDPSLANVTFADLKAAGLALVRAEIEAGNLADAHAMVTNLGDDFAVRFREMAFSTTQREFRRSLLAYLDKEAPASVTDADILALLDDVERLYASSSFDDELACPVPDRQGYLEISVAALARWSRQSLAEVMIEASPELAANYSSKEALHYFVTRNLWALAVDYLRRAPHTALAGALQDCLPLAVPGVDDLLLREAAAMGIVLASDKADAKRLLARLASAGTLRAEVLGYREQLPDMLSFFVAGGHYMALHWFLDACSIEVSDELARSFPSPCWSFLVHLIRRASSDSAVLSQVSFPNARFVLDVDPDQLLSVQTMLDHKRPLMALATLAVRARDAAPDGPQWQFRSESLSEALRGRYPFLARSLFPGAPPQAGLSPELILASRGGLSLYDLVRDASSDVDISRVFTAWDAGVPELADLLPSAARLQGALGPLHHLAAARPVQALLTEGHTEPETACLAICLGALDDRHVERACVTYLVLLERTAAVERLEADLAVARLVVDHLEQNQGRVTRRAFETRLGGPWLAEVWTQRDPSAKALDFLQEMLSRAEAAVSAQVAALDSTGDTAEPWEVVSRFCRVHEMPVHLRYYSTLAAENRWEDLIAASDRDGLSALDLARALQHLPNEALRSHLLSLTRHERADQVLDPGQRVTTKQVVEAIAVLSRGAEYPGRALLWRAVTWRSAFLAVVASHCEDVTPLQCLIVYLCALCEEAVPFLAPASLAVGDGPADPARELDLSLSDLGTIIYALCKRELAFVVMRGLLIFDPNSSVPDLLLFAQSFVRHRFDEARQHLRTFGDALRAGDDSAARIGDSAWILTLTADLIDWLQGLCMHRSQQSRLLHMLAEARVGNVEQYERLAYAADMLHSLGLEVDAREDPNELLGLLMQHRHFTWARDFARYFGLPLHRIALEQCRLMAVDLKAGPRWGVLEEREDLWDRCHRLLREQQCYANIAGDFFLDQLACHSADVAVLERVQLLELAMSWFDGTASQDSSPCRSAEFLAEIESKTILAKAGVDVQKTSELPAWVSRITASSRSIEAEAKEIFGDQLDADAAAFLDRLLSQLLVAGKVRQARRLCTDFAYRSLDMTIVEVVDQLAEDSSSIRRLDDALVTMIWALDPEFDVESATPSAVLALLSECAPSEGSSRYCQLAMTNFKVARLLQVGYGTVLEQGHDAVLNQLATHSARREAFVLAKEYIERHGVAAEDAGRVLAEVVAGGAAANWATDELREFAGILGSRVGVLGSEMLALATGGERSVAERVDLLVRAHFCFGMSGSVEGSARVLQYVRSQARIMAEADEFKQLVRLMAGLQAFRELEVIFDLLLEFDQFELVLSRHGELDAEGQRAFANALASYMKARRPEDKDRLTMVYLRFNMFREIAQAKLETANRSIEAGPRSAAELTDTLQLYLEAAREFRKEDCHTMTECCVFKAALVALQIKTPGVQLINLSAADAPAAMASRTIYHDAAIVANAYALNQAGEWAEVIYQQAIVAGNAQFYADYCRARSGTPALFKEMAKRFKSDGQKSARTQAFTKFVEQIRDNSVRREIAQQTGLTAIVESVNQKPGYRVYG